jgi:1-acyl-sn-glycerol-3-phosphate acyltransferase
MDATTPRRGARAVGAEAVGGTARGALSVVAARSPRLVAFFDRVFVRTFRRDMRALRLARWGAPAVPSDGAPLVVFASHPSWWDGISVMLLSRRLFPRREVFAPMEASALARYPFMRRIGVFGVEAGSARGAAAFLRGAAEVLGGRRGRILWVHAAGRFADVRERPVAVAPGLARLPETAPADAAFLPLAVEYVFWTERRPEALAAFGPPLAAGALLALDRTARLARLSGALEATMDRLAADAIACDPARFETLLDGREGMGGVYGAWQRARAALRGERFDPRHGTGAPLP